MDANLYQSLSARTIVNKNEIGPTDHLLNGALGASCESAEILQHVQRYLFCGKSLDVEALVSECGDVLWYISYILTTLGYTLEDCMDKNIYKLEDRYKDRINNYNLKRE